MVQLATIHDQILAHSAQLWAISPQSVEKNQTLAARRSIPFPVLADPDQVVIREWGLFNEDDPKGRPIPHPATYIVASGGRIQWVHIGKSTRDRPAPEDILEQLEVLGS